MFLLAATLANLDRLEEARATVETALALDPAFTIAYWRSVRLSDNPTFLAQRERVYEGRRKEGCRRDDRRGLLAAHGRERGRHCENRARPA
jgi:hypothetical protein